ncbi:hypothetical protein PQQ88_33230, partial [Paraburkholderia caledonica]
SGQTARSKPVSQPTSSLPDGDITVFDSVGFALEDYSTLRYLCAQSRRIGAGQMIHLIPRPADPKDLFGVLCSSKVQWTTDEAILL